MIAVGATRRSNAVIFARTCRPRAGGDPYAVSSRHATKIYAGDYGSPPSRGRRRRIGLRSEPKNKREEVMGSNNTNSLDRRHFLGAGALALGALNLGLPDVALAQANDPGGKKIAQLLADFIVRFDLKAAPPEAIDRARV